MISKVAYFYSSMKQRHEKEKIGPHIFFFYVKKFIGKIILICFVIFFFFIIFFLKLNTIQIYLNIVSNIALASYCDRVPDT